MAVGRLACDELAKGAGKTPNMATNSPGGLAESSRPAKGFGSNELFGLCGGIAGLWEDAEQRLLKADNAHSFVVDHADAGCGKLNKRWVRIGQPVFDAEI